MITATRYTVPTAHCGTASLMQDGRGFGKTVLGGGARAREHSCKRWQIDEVWQAGKSGKEMKNLSPYKHLSGETTPTKNSRAALL